MRVGTQNFQRIKYLSLLDNYANKLARTGELSSSDKPGNLEFSMCGKSSTVVTDYGSPMLCRLQAMLLTTGPMY